MERVEKDRGDFVLVLLVIVLTGTGIGAAVFRLLLLLVTDLAGPPVPRAPGS